MSPASAVAPYLAGFDEHLKQLRQSHETVYFLCYDIITLRYINCAFGHAAGDALITAVYDWVQAQSSGALFRVDGDLFCLVLTDLRTRDVQRLVQRIRQRFHKGWCITVEGETHEIYADVNLAIIQDGLHFWGCHMPDLFSRALGDSLRSRQTPLFDAEADHKSRERIRLRLQLQRCILRDMEGFDVYFQPIANAASGTWQGLEALCRWNGPDGPVPPLIFIPLAEKLGLIHLIGQWVLRQAVATCKRQGLDELDGFFLSVNISPSEVTEPGFATVVLATCERNAYPCGKLILEITESTEFAFTRQTAAAIQRLRDKGVRLALDDFGTGFSSFANLKKLPVDFIKTEREFLAGIEDDNYLQYFYYTMAETAHASDKMLIAEGIETPQQLLGVRRNGADLVQGYLFARPLPAAELGARREQFRRETSTPPPLPTLDFKRWLSGSRAYKITPSLFSLLNQCMNIALAGSTVDDALNGVLEKLGTSLMVNRAYVFLQDEGTLFSNRYEWCADGCESQMALFQQVDVTRDGFFDLLRDNDMVIATNTAQLPANMQTRLEEGRQSESVQAMVVLPMKLGDGIVGFVGFDDDHPRNWMPEEVISLHILCLLALLVLRGGGIQQPLTERGADT